MMAIPAKESERSAEARRIREAENEDLILASDGPQAMLLALRQGCFGRVRSPVDRFEVLIHAARQEPTGRALKLLLEEPCGAPIAAILKGRHEATGNPLLHVPCYRGFPKAVAYLLAKGADMGALDRSRSDALHYVLQGTGNNVAVGTEADFLAIVRFFHAKKWDVTQTVFRNTKTASLHLVCARGSVAMAEFLLGVGADVNERETSPCDPMTAIADGVHCLGGTPLHKAAHAGNVKLVTLLLAHGADTRLRQLGHKQSLPVEMCLSGNVRVAHAIFEWERTHKIEAAPVGDDERGRHVSDHNVEMLLEMVQTYRATSDVTGGFGTAPTVTASWRGQDSAEQLACEMRARTKSAQASNAQKEAHACSAPGCDAQHFDMMLCTGCGLARYCSKRCQKAHWKAGHRAKCRCITSKGLAPHTVTPATNSEAIASAGVAESTVDDSVPKREGADEIGSEGGWVKPVAAAAAAAVGIAAISLAKLS